MGISFDIIMDTYNVILTGSPPPIYSLNLLLLSI
jgi:hypothetical protein